MPRAAKKSSSKATLPKPKSPPRRDPVIANLEPVASAAQVYSLQQLLTNKANPRTRDAARLGDVLLPWYEKMIARPAEKLETVTELWHALVPARLLQRTRLLGLAKGTLSVAIDSAPLRADLEAQLRSGLLGQLQTTSRGTIYRVKTCVQSVSSDTPDLRRQ